MPPLGEHLSTRFRMTVIGLAAGFLGAWFVIEDLGGVIFVAVLLGIPYVVYLLSIRTRGASIGSGIVLVAMIIAIHVLVYADSESSTGALAYLLIPVAGVLIVAGAVIWERLAGRSPQGNV